MTQKRTRRKPYKYMSVSELVKAREGLVEQVQEIDSILKLAVEAVGARIPIASKPTANNQALSSLSKADAALFGQDYMPTANVQSIPQILPSTEPPAVTPNPNAPNAASAFSLFDTDSWVHQQNELSKQMMTQSEYNVEEMEQEVSDLKQQIAEEIENVKNSTTAAEAGEENISTAA